MKSKPVLYKIFTNQWLLYIVAALSIYKIIQYLCINDIIRVLIFIVSALITRYFTRNMIIILGIPLVLSVISNHIYFEGFTDTDSSITPAPTNPTPKPTEVPDIILPADETGSSNTDSTPSSTDQSSEHYENRVNYAKTLGDNMKSYRELLGSDGFAQMTADTQELLNQQEKLGKSIRQFAPIIEKMTPFLTQASGLLSKLDNTQLQEITKTIKNI
jgi:hypothetical protein